ncbi:MAG TPA: DUF1178 family protein [Xanthobacteraceae bacterium]|nr:DUF1178 family protein [Xanthobacteraceae bacterium]
MIRYTLVCDKRHEFESWFTNSTAYDKQARRGLVTCPLCGSAKVEKALMAPRLARADAPPAHKATQAQPSPAETTPTAAKVPTPVAMISPQEQEIRRKLRELRDHLVKNAEDVGPRFPEEARKMHYGEAEHRSIYGVASPKDAKALHEEGIEFSPLPVLPDEHN